VGGRRAPAAARRRADRCGATTKKISPQPWKGGGASATILPAGFPRGRAMRKIGLILLLLLSLPILLFVYQPSVPLGFTAYVLGTIGRTLSPLILFGALLYVIARHWKG
jgi:hypothetical protein